MAVRSPEPSLDDQGLARLLTYGGGAAVVAAFLLPVHAVEDGPAMCPFRVVTGLPCPACGLTRSWVTAAHGDLAASLSFHWFGAALLIAVAAYAVVGLVRRSRGRPLAAPHRLLPMPLVVGAVGVLLAYGVVRLVLVATGAASWPG